MTTLLTYKPSLALSPFSGQTLTPLRRAIARFPAKNSLRGHIVARAMFDFGPEAELTAGALRDILGRAEGFFYTVADATVASSSTSAPPVEAVKQSDDWFSGIANYMESILKVLQGGLTTLHVPYAYGFAIILLTVLVKAATFPLSKKQVESTMAMKSLQPQLKAIQQRFAGDQERIQLETARLYKVAGINPLAGCLPTLATIPVWIGLYRALSNAANEGLLTEGFFWIPSLSGPTTIIAQQKGSGISWLYPFVDGHPPLGWSDTFAYLVLPTLLIVSQYISVQIMQSAQSNDPNMKSSQLITKLLPLMIGYFALSVPSGLSLYWLTNNILSTAQQVWLQKLGGAKVPSPPVSQLTPDVVTEDKPEIQKTSSELTLTQKDSPKEKMSTAQGPRPGERFRQLKAEEERKRRQREEEKKKAEETSAKLDAKNEETLAVVKNSQVHTSENNNHSSSGSVNGNTYRSDFTENRNNMPSTFQTTDNEDPASLKVDERGLGKEEVEVRTASISRDTEPSEED